MLRDVRQQTICIAKVLHGASQVFSIETVNVVVDESDNMDQSDDMVSSDRESRLGQTSTKKARPSQRIPKCTRCQNHGKKVQVKFHKRECEFRYCLCEMCILTTKRQQIMKVQTAQRRARQQHEMVMIIY